MIRATALSPANNLHWFQSETITPVSRIIASLADDCSYHVWHQCFSHISRNALHHVSIHLSGVPTLALPKDLPSCKSCQIGKMPDHAFPASEKWASCPLALVHMELVSPMPTEPHSQGQYMYSYFC